MENFLIKRLYKYSAILYILVPIIFSGKLSAQEEFPLITDRPDVTESAIAVPINSFQIETGFMYQKQKITEYGTTIENDNLILASTLFRYGINNKLELRFGGEYLSGKTTEGLIKSDIQGLEGLFVGSKLQLMSNHYIVGDIALILELGLPFGNENLRPDKIEPKFIIAVARDIEENFSIGINIGSQYASDVGKNHIVYSTSFGIGLSDRIGTFIEYYGDAVDGLVPQHNFDFGFTYLQKKNVQIDASIGTVILTKNINWYGSIGFSVRLGNNN